MLKIIRLRGILQSLSFGDWHLHSNGDSASADSAMVAQMRIQDVLKGSILRFTTLAILSALSFVLLSPAALAANYQYWERTDNVTFGVHPWDQRPRRARSTLDPLTLSKSFFYLHPDRSQTHALHPYNRDNYYAPPVAPLLRNYSSSYNNRILYALEDAYIPERAALADCENYSYVKPNYRVPPFGYSCSQ